MKRGERSSHTCQFICLFVYFVCLFWHWSHFTLCVSGEKRNHFQGTVSPFPQLPSPQPSPSTPVTLLMDVWVDIERKRERERGGRGGGRGIRAKYYTCILQYYIVCQNSTLRLNNSLARVKLNSIIIISLIKNSLALNGVVPGMQWRTTVLYRYRSACVSCVVR